MDKVALKSVIKADVETIIAKLKRARRKRMYMRRLITFAVLVVIFTVSLLKLGSLTKPLKGYAQEPTVNQKVQAVDKPTQINTIKSIAPVVEKQPAVEKSIYNSNIPMPKEHQEYLYKMCKARGLDYKKALAVIKHESQFDPNNITNRDYGYFQVNKSNHEDLAMALNTPNEPLDPYININWGTYMLSDIYKYWEARGLQGEELEDYVLSTYNEGLRGFKKYGKAVQYIQKVQEEEQYINKIF